jgi:ankyrin repeat protein
MLLSPEFARIVEKYKNHPEFLGMAIEHPNQAGAVDDTLLHLAARVDAVEDVRALVALGVDVDIVGDMGNTPLHTAAMLGKSATVAELLRLGAATASKNEFDQTPLDVALLANEPQIVELLKRHAR